ncbi:WXG100 family type VII secretion target [Nocardia sp. NPDC059240]|uniref:WXG100 family type VII secretion target n=1 Tax=Nocardia sp. NPDC059240 TaxID=3346786 RepID=UPI0036ACB225
MSGGSLDSNDSNQVSAEHDVAEKAKNHMADIISTVKATLKKCTDAVDAVKPGFQGDAAGTFKTASDAWHAEADKLNTKLDAIQDQVGVGTQLQQHADGESASGFTKFTTL